MIVNPNDIVFFRLPDPTGTRRWGIVLSVNGENIAAAVYYATRKKGDHYIVDRIQTYHIKRKQVLWCYAG